MDCTGCAPGYRFHGRLSCPIWRASRIAVSDTLRLHIKNYIHRDGKSRYQWRLTVAKVLQDCRMDGSSLDTSLFCRGFSAFWTLELEMPGSFAWLSQPQAPGLPFASCKYLVLPQP